MGQRVALRAFWWQPPGMNLVLSDGTVWKGVVPLKFSEDWDSEESQFAAGSWFTRWFRTWVTCVFLLD
jgi:hypothetical protein